VRAPCSGDGRAPLAPSLSTAGPADAPRFLPRSLPLSLLPAPPPTATTPAHAPPPTAHPTKPSNLNTNKQGAVRPAAAPRRAVVAVRAQAAATGAATLARAPVPLALEAGDMPLNTFSNKTPFVGKVRSVERCVGPKATGDTFHIIIDTEGNIPFWEGQSYGVIPPGTKINSKGKEVKHGVRLYSIASSRYGDAFDGQTASLCVRRATYWDAELNKEDPAKEGICSNFLARAVKGCVSLLFLALLFSPSHARSFSYCPPLPRPCFVPARLLLLLPSPHSPALLTSLPTLSSPNPPTTDHQQTNQQNKQTKNTNQKQKQKQKQPQHRDQHDGPHGQGAAAAAQQGRRAHLRGHGHGHRALPLVLAPLLLRGRALVQVHR